ncbi:MAG: tRNA (adenosine(37)-N6)-dimethylallyltransferase MiaA [Bacteroidales bacterium]|nr:tRNA (adenosine(37)-N6)-dimethylallyltransferase MiaA [Bacteroidales bacterium]HPD95480.1 tRNA (adenosine(37)-N6)-dimethylallyltransferase MiaA [Tenuifilaceae bacterium]
MPAGKRHLIVILGPTGVGKTDLSIELATLFNAPIISADSRQFFKEMNVGTAKPTPEQLQKVPHYFVGNKSVSERYSCGMFELDAISTLESVYSKGEVALLVGGSGLYIDALLNGIDDFPTPDSELRENLYEQLNRDGVEGLRAQLKLLDPDYYQKVDLKNTQRIIKALEVCLQTGKTYTSFLTQPKKPRPFSAIKVGLNLPREELYDRINRRVDLMVDAGLVDEAKSLYPHKEYNALHTVGYSELFDYFDGKLTLDEAIELIKRNSRRYAKRQLTWWARDKEISWFTPRQKDEIVNYIKQRINS